jgi:hypothetical protein
MTMTYKGLAALSMINVEVKQVEEKPMAQTKQTKVETYQPVENVVGVPGRRMPVGTGVNDPKKLRVKSRFVQKQGMTPIQMAIHKYDQKRLQEQMSDRSYKAWAEAVARRHYKDVHITATAEELIQSRTKVYPNIVEVKYPETK